MNLDFLHGEDCERCGSPFHQAKDCPNKTRPKFRFKTRKELGLKPGELPFKFRVEINPEVDDEVEVARKRALLRLNSQRIYSAMGFAVRSHDALLESAKWLNAMLEHVEEDEKGAYKSIFDGLRILEGELKKVREAKVEQAVKMEEILDKSRKQARRVRKTLEEKKTQKLRKKQDFFVVRLPALDDNETEINIPVAADNADNPLAVFEDIKKAVLRKEKMGKSKYLSGDHEDQ